VLALRRDPAQEKQPNNRSKLSIFATQASKLECKFEFTGPSEFFDQANPK